MNEDLIVSGSLWSFDNEYSIAGATIRAVTDSSSLGNINTDSHYSGVQMQVGRVQTDADGSFTISSTDNPDVQSGICYLKCSGKALLVLQVIDTDETVIAEVRDLPINGAQVKINLPDFSRDVNARTWKDFSELMQQYRTVNMGRISTELTALTPTGMFSNWTISKRMAVLASLENAFLDPTNVFAQYNVPVRMSELQDAGKREALRNDITRIESPELLQAFDDATIRSNMAGHLNVTDVLLDPVAFADGDISKGVNEFVGRFGSGIFDVDLWPDFYDHFPWTRSPVIGYRDYLVDIWVQKATTQLPDQLLKSNGAIEQLNNRFHQNFKTFDLKSSPVNELLAGILKQILQAPTGTGAGFAVAAASIEDQKERSDREYLDYLISLTGESLHEIENRYRLNLSQSDLETSDPVQLNIFTLQRFFADSFQSVTDPFATLPPLTGNGLPIINEYTYKQAQHGPFFWQYDEWLERDEPFYAENYFDIRRTFFCYISADERATLWTRTVPLDKIYHSRTDDHSYDPPKDLLPGLSQAIKVGDQWARNMLELQDRLNDAHKDFFGGFFTEAERKYKDLLLVVRDLQKRLSHWGGTAFEKYSEPATASYQRGFNIKDPETLAKFEELYHTNYDGYMDSIGPGASMAHSWVEIDDQLARQPYLIALLLNRLIPACLAETRLALGKFREAVQGGTVGLLEGMSGYYGYENGLAGIVPFNVYTGPTPFEPGSKITSTVDIWWPTKKDTGSLPFSTDNAVADQKSLISQNIYFPANKSERAYFRLKLGEALLDWADTLYRTNHPDSKARARELYKGVLFLHGEDPKISPVWALDWPALGLGILPLGFGMPVRNPALTVQINRAQIGFDQLNAGLNYYGFPDDYVPPVRYRVLRELAERFAASAKNTQNDYLNYMQKYEQAIIDEMTAGLLVEKASYSIRIAAEQIEIANFAVGEAQKQVESVKAQIAAKRKEIADADGFFEQAKSFFGGMKDAAQGLATSFMGEMEGAGAAGGGAVSTSDLSSMYKVISSKGSTSAATAGLTGGMAIMAGYGAFVYAGYTSMQSMADAAAKRGSDLKSLEEGALPAAQKMVELKKREVTIANLTKQIAEADYNFGKKMLAFYDYRFLSKAFWQQMTTFSNRLMRRYLDLGGRTAWFAERALSFEVDQDIRIVSFDYFSRALRGVTGADTLQLHLAEMEAGRVQGLSQTIPVKHTFSLSRDFPLAWGQLKKTGTCRFSTSELSFKSVYPGVYAYRLRCVSVGTSYADSAMPHKGMLLNDGFSVVSRNDSSMHRLLRYPDALPLSEFNMRDDMFVYELPDETLLPFEGSGVETIWQLNMSLTRDAKTLETLTDVLITFDMRARYSAVLRVQQEALLPVQWNKSIMISGKSLNPVAFAKFRKDGGQLRITFDPAVSAANSSEKTRTINLIGLVLAGVSEPVVAKLTADTDAVTADFQFDNGVALSNTGVMAAANAGVPLPLNTLTGISANQKFVFELNQDDNPGIDFSNIADVQLYIDYEAKL